MAGLTVAYANNDIGVHRVENRSPDKPAYTMHIYAPGLRKIKVFKEQGNVCVHTVAHVSLMSEDGSKVCTVCCPVCPQILFALNYCVPLFALNYCLPSN